MYLLKLKRKIYSTGNKELLIRNVIEHNFTLMK